MKSLLINQSNKLLQSWKWKELKSLVNLAKLKWLNLTKLRNYLRSSPVYQRSLCSICLIAPMMWLLVTSYGWSKSKRKSPAYEKKKKKKSIKRNNAHILQRFGYIKDNRMYNSLASENKEWSIISKDSPWWRKGLQPLALEKKKTIQLKIFLRIYIIRRMQTAISLV